MGHLKGFKADARLKQWYPLLLVGLLALVVALLTFYDYTGYEITDPHLSLLVSQAILEQGTIRLDAYVHRAEPPLDTYSSTGPLIIQEGHYYYYFPLGPSMFSLPFVAAARRLGLDMAEIAGNHLLQEFISSLLCALSVPLIYGICRNYLGPSASLVITAVSILGSGLVSTMGTALWNIDYAVIFMLATLWLLTRYDTGKRWWFMSYVLGMLLFAAYFCRASAVSFIVAVFVYLFWRDWRMGAKVAAVAALLLGISMAISWVQSGSFFPAYYAVARLQVQREPLPVVAFLHLFSPSRGLLVFSPFLGLVLLAALLNLPWLRCKPLYWSSWIWLGSHLVIVSRSTRWWGGHGYGPRLLTEVVPALVLLTILVWREESRRSVTVRWIAAAAYLLLGGWAIFVHSYQGLFNIDTPYWNGAIIAPDVDSHPQYLLSWEYPQFLADRQALCERNRAYIYRVLAENPVHFTAYALGTKVTYESGLTDPIDATRQGYLRDFNLTQFFGLAKENGGEAEPSSSSRWRHVPPREREPIAGNAALVGWSAIEQSRYRWSQCRQASVIVGLADIQASETHLLELWAGSYGEQIVIVHVNGVRVGQLAFAGSHLPAQKRALMFSGTFLRPNRYNEITFVMPNASRPGPKDPRYLGLAFSALRVSPLDTATD
jgi:hypothetical protein